jgi:hypothetical protein
MSIFTDQGYSTITLETGVDCTSATVKRILWKNPNGTTGYFTATVTNTTALTYQATDTDWTVSGEWQFQAYVEIGGLNAYGDIVYQTIKAHL